MVQHTKQIPDSLILYGSYLRGYTAAILDIMEVFDYIQVDLIRHNKRLTHKLIAELLKCCFENKEELLNSQEGFIRYNNKTQIFEFYKPET